MYISSKGEYGLRALFDLAQRYGNGPVASEAIAARQSIPPQLSEPGVVVDAQSRVD